MKKIYGIVSFLKKSYIKLISFLFMAVFLYFYILLSVQISSTNKNIIQFSKQIIAIEKKLKN